MSESDQIKRELPLEACRDQTVESISEAPQTERNAQESPSVEGDALRRVEESGGIDDKIVPEDTDKEEAEPNAIAEETAVPFSNETVTQNGNDSTELPAANEDREYRYVWNYADQAAFDREARVGMRQKGARTYIMVMASVFLLCFAMLAGVLIWNAVAGMGSGIDLPSTADIAASIRPTTVLITSSSSREHLSGSGFFIRSDGYILTNFHVVKGCSEIIVTTYDGVRRNATTVGYDEVNDLAVLKIAGRNYSVPTFGDSATVRTGDDVIAVGNPTGAAGAWSVTKGIISATNRIIGVEASDGTVSEVRMFQTDAAVNHGNSGGPLCNNRGEVIGVVTRKKESQSSSEKSAYIEAISFAIPINDARAIAERLIQK